MVMVGMPRARRQRHAAAPKPPRLSEKAFQAMVVRAARLYGWRVYFTYRSVHSPPGEPDLRLVRPPRYCLIELKTEVGKLSPAQVEAAALLRQCPGIEYYLWRPDQWDEVIAVLGRAV